MVGLPEYDVLNFSFDNDNGCSLTVLANHERFHITVNPKQFQDRSKKGKDIQRTYRRLLGKAKAAEQDDEEEGSSASETEEQGNTDDEECIERERDSAVDVSTPEVDDKEAKETNNSDPVTALQNWILSPLSQHMPSPTSKTKSSLQDWYHCPIHFYKLYTASGKLQAKRVSSPAWSLRERLNELLIPTVCLPKKTLKLSVPQINASELTVLSCAADPAPFHPVLVSHNRSEYFLKPVDSTQPNPTIREIHLLHTIAEKGLHSREDFRCPELRGLVYFASSSEPASKERNHIAALLLTPIPNPTPLTRLLDTSVPEHKRSQWAKDTERMVEVLHENDIIWGDAKGDNFLVDGKEENVWIIDFGGSYTEGWVDEKIKETVEGDWMGTEKVINALDDPINGIEDEDVEQAGGMGEAIREQEEEEEDDEDSESKEVDEEACLEAKDASELEPADDKETLNSDQEDETSSGEERSRKRSHSTAAKDGDDTQPPPSKQQKLRSQNDQSDEDQDDAKLCSCNGVSSGRMLACDGEDCKRKWFHFECLGIEEAPDQKKWFCDDCR